MRRVCSVAAGYEALGIAAACVAMSSLFDFGAVVDAVPLLMRQTFAVRAKAADEPQARRRKDRLFPWQDAERLVNTATCETELLMLEEGNTAAPTSRHGTGRTRLTGWSRGSAGTRQE